MAYDKQMYVAGDDRHQSNYVAFNEQSWQDLDSWLRWAASDGTNPATPSGYIYMGPKGSVPATRYYPGDIAIGSTEANELKEMAQYNIEDCVDQLSSHDGFVSSCVAAFGDIQSVFRRRRPWTTTPISPNFSQLDWAKAVVLNAFQGEPMTALAPDVEVDASAMQNWQDNGFINEVKVNLTSGAPPSGLGVYRVVANNPMRITDVSPTLMYMDVPRQEQMPLQKVGTIKNLIIQTVGAEGSANYNNIVNDIKKRCKQIQPRTTDAQVDTLLRTDFPMSPWQNGATDAGANKLYIYLPNADLSQNLIISNQLPPFHTGRDPDGTDPTNSMDDRYNVRYNINGTLVNTSGTVSGRGDEAVHIAPYVQMNSTLEPYVVDQAMWWPGSGAENILGRLRFRELGLGNCTYSQIN